MIYESEVDAHQYFLPGSLNFQCYAVLGRRDVACNISMLHSHHLGTDARAFNMAADVVFSSTTGAGALRGQLFDGMKFWFSAKVPQRSRFINDIKVSFHGPSRCVLKPDI